MKKYKVICIAILLKNNVQANYGTLVTADQLTDSAETLVNAGYIAEDNAAEAPASPPVDADPVGTAQGALDAAQAAFDNAAKVLADAVADKADDATISAANDALAKAKMALTLAKGQLTKAVNAAKK